MQGRSGGRLSSIDDRIRYCPYRGLDIDAKGEAGPTIEE